MIGLALLAGLLAPPSHEALRRDAYRLFELLNPDSRIVLRTDRPDDYSAELAWPIALRLGQHPVGEGWWAPRLLGEFLLDSDTRTQGVFLGAGAILARKDGLAVSAEAGWQYLAHAHTFAIGGGPAWSWADLGQLRALYRAALGAGVTRHVLGVDFEIFFDL